MIDEETLNKKLAEQFNFKPTKKRYEASFVEGAKGREFDVTIWLDPSGEPYGELDFTTSLDACFKYLVPEVSNSLISKEDIAVEETYQRIFGLWLKEMTYKEPALALCLTIEKLIEKDKR